MINNKLFKSTLLILIPLGLIINNIYALYGQIFTRVFVNDEVQHMHIAWNIFQGQLIYRDFFEHHGPLYGLLNGYIFSKLSNPASFDTLLLLRQISLLTTVLMSVVLFFIAKRVTKSKYIAMFSVAIFFMWDIVQRTAIEIRPDLLQNLFWLLAFYLFIKYYRREKPWAMYLTGSMLGIMLCFNVKSAAVCLALLVFLIIDAIRFKSSKGFKDLLWIFLGGSTIVLTTTMYFYLQGGLRAFIYYNTVFNLGFIDNIGSHIAQKIHRYLFFVSDAVLSFWFLLGLTFINYKSRSFQLMLLCILTGLYSIFKGLYPHNCMIFLPFCSIISACCLNRLVLHDFRSNKQSLIQWVQVLLLLWICLGTPMKNLLIYPSKEEDGFIEIKRNITWVLKNLPREQTVATLWNNCGGNIFNADPQFYWTAISTYFSKAVGYNIKGESLVLNLEQHQTPIITAYEKEIIKLPDISRNYILSNYRLLPINQGSNCIWARRINPKLSTH